MKKILSFLLVLLPVLSFAEAVPENRARAVAEAFLQQQVQTKSGTVRLELVDCPQTRIPFAPALYLYNNMAGQGFVLVAGDDIAAPVLGYSLTGNARSGQLPPQFTYWMEFLSREITWAREQGIPASRAIRTRWEHFSTGTKAGNPLLGRKVEIGNVVKRYQTAAWDQDAPYWNECPEYQGERTYTGCVITAACIVMRWNGWPDCGVGFSPKYSTATNHIFVDARNFGRPYDWESMPLAYKKGRYTNYEAQQVARLMADVGAILEADYGLRENDGTGAFMESVPKALSTYMKYDKRIYLSRRDFFNSNEWLAKVKAELDQRPIIYGGLSRDGGGHAFVFDGYTDKDYFHVNWGWSGVSDGWFLLTALDPEQQGAGGANSGFSTAQDAIFNMYRDAGGVMEDQIVMVEQNISNGNRTHLYHGIEVSPTVPVPGEKFQLGAGVFYNNTQRDFVGEIVIALVDRMGEVLQPLRTVKFTAANPLPAGRVTWFEPGEVVIDDEFFPGDRIKAMFTTGDQSEWKPVLYNMGQPGFIGEVVLVEDIEMDGSLEECLKLYFDKTRRELEITLPENIEVTLATEGGEDKSSVMVRGGLKLKIDGNLLGKGTYFLTFHRGTETKVLKITL